MSSVWIAYADDSGDEKISLHCALLVPVESWSDGLMEWKKYRRSSHRRHKVPTQRELHASDWITGKDNPAPKGEPVNSVVGIRHEWTRKALQAIGKMPGVGVFTVVSPTPVKADAYRDFLLQLDGAMRDCGDRVVLIMDGDPKNPDRHVQEIHRELTFRTRHIIEDGWIQDSAQSQFVQMADIVVHCAFQHHVRNPEREFMWSWYPHYLHDLEWSCTCLKAVPS